MAHKTIATNDDWSKVANPSPMKMETLEEFKKRILEKNDDECRKWGIPKWVGRFTKAA